MKKKNFVLYILILFLFILMCINRKEKFKNINLKNLKVLKLFNTSSIGSYEYSPYYSIKNYKAAMYGEHMHNLSKLFFKICDYLNFDYIVFAGSSIGLIRNKKMMPWTDDYDIIVMDKYKKYFKEVVRPELLKYGFKIWGYDTDEQNNPGCNYIAENIKHYKQFRVDIFWSTFDEDNNLINMDRRGLYHRKKIPRSCVLPKKYYNFNGINLPFFNDHIKEVLFTYGDVHKECIISSHSKRMPEKVVYKSWQNALHDFNLLRKISIQNTKNKIKDYKFYKPDNKILLVDGYMNTQKILNKISKDKISIVNFTDCETFMKQSLNVIFYFPNVKLNLFLNDLTKIEYIYLNYANNVYVKNNKMKKILNELVYIRKPNIIVTKIITFGTFDLFHKGHKNIINKCKNLSDNVVIGISTDELNSKKGKKSFDSLQKRLYNVQKYSNSKVFKEESLEKKNHYIKSNNCNVLVMGNDWENKFNWVSSDILYLPRTPGISSTLLRNRMKKL